MACGNNHVSRDYLSSPPAPAKSAASALSKPQVQLPSTARRLPEVRIGNQPPRQGFQSRVNTRTGVVDYFIGPDGQQTHEPALHVHVIHQANGDVTMHITDRQDGTTKHSTQIELKSPDGNQVRDAERALAEVLGSLR
ncbi:hypothetical protein BN13_200005 [Nostocoides jenkinsii Ben 74]|uniref:Uncharacterized protein n=1 Tax=Nostocoides jenkinsii Ben 74 TaxID=1193518 RepID=A0A077MA75_9MICO|nr:hypothetical protein BN13_200005 [Tetrasphaera jenkinsii Ben 74]